LFCGIFSLNSDFGGSMSYKQVYNNFSLTDLSLFNSMKHNRSISRMEKTNAIINCSRIENLLLKHYTIGRSTKRAGAYPPLLLLKCFLIRQWFHIDSDHDWILKSMTASLSRIFWDFSLINPLWIIPPLAVSETNCRRKR